MTGRLRRGRVAVAAAIGLGLSMAPSAAATAPPGSWTRVWSSMSSGYEFYACKISVPNSPYGPLWRVKVFTNFNNQWREMQDGRGVVAAVMRGPNNYVSWSANHGWYYGWNGLETHASQLFPDRIWIQSDGWGGEGDDHWNEAYPVVWLRYCS